MWTAAAKFDLTVAEATVAEGPLSAIALRRWLHGRWALLFSHPDDFAAYGFEADRWLVHVEEAFAATDIRPLALAGDHEASWVREVGGCTTSLALDEIQRYPVARDSREEALRNVAFEPATRFVMTLDSSLRLRRTFVYTSADRLPSPMDLAVIAKGLRDGSRSRHAAGRNTPAIPCRR
jgi:alkyl hydroperoxide reductase subunit AhpC